MKSDGLALSILPKGMGICYSTIPPRAGSNFMMQVLATL